MILGYMFGEAHILHQSITSTYMGIFRSLAFIDGFGSLLA
jgi:hypothetical protein